VNVSVIKRLKLQKRERVQIKGAMSNVQNYKRYMGVLESSSNERERENCKSKLVKK
jgi:hypothetical protein